MRDHTALVEKVAEMLIEGFQHCDCSEGPCTSYAYRTEGKCYCRDQAASVINFIRAEVLEEAAIEAENHNWMADIEWWLNATKKEVSSKSAEESAAAIRALKEKK